MKTLKEHLQSSVYEYVKERYSEQWFDAETNEYRPELGKSDILELTEKALEIIDEAIDEKLPEEYDYMIEELKQAEKDSYENHMSRLAYYCGEGA